MFAGLIFVGVSGRFCALPGPANATTVARAIAAITQIVCIWRNTISQSDFIWNQSDLERKLENYKSYYNQDRCHTGLAGVTPTERGGVY